LRIYGWQMADLERALIELCRDADVWLAGCPAHFPGMSPMFWLGAVWGLIIGIGVGLFVETWLSRRRLPLEASGASCLDDNAITPAIAQEKQAVTGSVRDADRAIVRPFETT
jgi:hypothetical protein